jgi:WD40 repeat protein
MLPSAKPPEMVVSISHEVFVTSNDGSSLAVWVSKKAQYVLAGTARYDPKYGVANSAALLRTAGKQWLVTGHSEGYIVIWHVMGFHLALKQAVLMRSPDPIPSPFKLWNVRGVVPWKNGIVVTGAEDGDICLVNVSAGKIQARTRYNPKAQRGINSLSVYNDYLALANCSVGTSDKNLWLYRLGTNQISLVDSLNLVKDTSLPQVFNFSVQLAALADNIYFFASTQEGLLWMGNILKDKLVTITNAKIAGDGGATIAFQPRSWMLSVAAFDIGLYTVLSKPQ